MIINLDRKNDFAFNLFFRCTETQKRGNVKKDEKWTIFAHTSENMYVKKNLLYVYCLNRYVFLYMPLQAFLTKFRQ